jgi:tRNA nucleotidyltransferase/poly(A) polymerase
VSDERLGIELDKMLEGNLPHQSVRYLHRFGVLSVLFRILENEYSTTVKDKAQHYEKVVEICENLGPMFETIKKESQAATPEL